MSFIELGVPRELARRLSARGITVPTPIQTATVAAASAGRDVCGRAPTGSGKTLAFGLAIAARISRGAPRRPRCLVLVPTRELASQVCDEIKQLVNKDVGVVAIYGGAGYGPQKAALAKGAGVVVACPGRLEDLLSTKDVRLDDVELVVLDEADRMADMGFVPAVRRLLDHTRPDRQTLLFSATLDGDVDDLIRDYQRDPLTAAAELEEDQGTVTHQFLAADRDERIDLVIETAREHRRTIVFCRTCHGADRLARRLTAGGLKVATLHGRRTQAQRERARDAFDRGQVGVLVATDVAARGLHIDGVGCVVHFDAPADAKDYVHRSGRTGRAGADGAVVSLVTPDQRKHVAALRRQLRLDEAEPPARRHTGTVKFFDARRGFGFIERLGDEDLFFHHSRLARRSSVEPGAGVSFTVVRGRKGDEASELQFA